ncbi:MAG TPA: ABC transporter permease [Gemmatales bacterium]|nr:ABC transporter permease [Gemmatales bacterium]HMP60540.1 ABC transporter permease [Gemmatales bacterium]
MTDGYLDSSTGASTTTLVLRQSAGIVGAGRRLLAVARKELIHILRDPATLFFTLVIPIMEMFMLGYAIDTNVRRIRTVVFDQCRTQESRRLLEQFKNSDIFRIVGEAFTDAELRRAIVAGEARIALKIPEDYTRKLLAGDTAQVLVLVDGSESSVASTALNVSNALTLRVALEQVLGERLLPVESRPQVLFNPDTRSANFFIPGLLVVMCQMMAVTLSAAAIVREKENGTLEQLFMTPVKAGELILGKMAPYVLLTMLEFCAIAFLMWLIFRVPIHGYFATLLGIFLPFLLAMLAIGLWASTRAATRDAAQQIAIGTVIPSIFLSGYVFPLDSMPKFFWYVAQTLPTTWMIDASRGVILRGAGWEELWKHAAVLWGMALFFMVMGASKFRKQL